MGGVLAVLLGAAPNVAATSPGTDLATAGPLTRPALISSSDPTALPRAIAIADEGNNRIVVVDPKGRVRWIFPQRGDLRPGQVFRVPDDVFFSPDGRSIIATEEENQMISVIDIAKRRITFQYGRSGHESFKKGYLANPDDAIMLKDGRLLIADIKNCRLLIIEPKTRATAQLGTSGRCVHNPPRSFASPNGAFPMSDGRYLVTEIGGDWVDAMSLDGKVSWSVHPPGQIVEFNSTGKLLWRYRPTGAAALDHTSLAHGLPNGYVIATDDRNNRVIVVDPKTNKVVWQYGHKGKKGRGAGYLNNPDGLDLLPPDSLLSSK